MSSNNVKIHKLAHGMTLITEPMKEVSSAAFIFLLPIGAADDPPQMSGAASVLAELIFRGTKDLDNRTLNDQLDSLGLHRYNCTASLYSSFGGSLLADNLLQAIKLYVDVLLRPALQSDQFEPCRELAIQSLDSLEDEPQQKISLIVREKYLPYPFGRCVYGKRNELQSLTPDIVKNHWAARLTPQGAVLAVAGKIDRDQIQETIERLLGDWSGPTLPVLEKIPPPSLSFHQPYNGAQVHAGFMYHSVPLAHQDYYAALAAVAILSGGMSSRLFTEVREKRGLCYAVGASLHVIGPYGVIQGYLGSTPDHAQQALDVTMTELTRLADGITENELERAKIGLRASLIMQGESTSARALGCVGDYFHLGRVRSLQEIEDGIKNLQVKNVIEYAQNYKPQGITLVTIGPKPLEINEQLKK